MFIQNLLSEEHCSERKLLVIVRKSILRYIDEQNWQLVPIECYEAGGSIDNEV